ncbi:MAG: NADP-specific glutamate dehydrogenase [Sulfuricurvum sp.]|uniref:NADP-specific glutamate dehydrogenase n=1 Tax=Sulfuricurvum sp. TaxID=2025608 RepID=UPI002601FDB1|nr:NADP-specific glutamate dehydrogenase [Sulfuricurvum sp.]MDD2838209.1 NADP-specific glutamate dehydrogenase [Sulfuricurvum sp.]MDD3595418.1 NADP-specific glutamate dehydrogenase [Sulfuricurvum sp.]MDD4884768.1 NADP-specific glutamate dehydrogenase [Sulfuricurvum sp.]
MVDKILANLEKSNCAIDNTFLQAVSEVLHSLEPIVNGDSRYETYAILERLVTPDRIIQFKVQWVDDQNRVQINNGYRIQFNNSLGPYKGGLRFHPSVSIGVLKFLAFEQIFKNSLTGLPIGGAKGGSDFDPKGKSDFEIMKFCRAFMRELHLYIGARIDVPAGDIGVGAREIGFLYGEYKRITRSYDGVLSGKPYAFGGSLLRPQATGYGVVYFAAELLKEELHESLEGKSCAVSGAGNVAIHTIEKLEHFGAKVITCSDSEGTIYDSRGIDLKVLKELKGDERHASLIHYIDAIPSAVYIKKEDYPQGGHAAWSYPCFAAFPCATQNELSLIDAQTLIGNGVRAVIEGANMPTTPEAIDLFQSEGVLFAPGKAANAGGVAVSEFEMSQNASMEKWDFNKVDRKLSEIMRHIYKRIALTAKEYGRERNFVDGANIAAFKRVAEAMILEGV